ncbi:MAG TPA: hypothetical protein VG796_08525 [Verrucomicrobiales bacterium]|nr:hypothetical protein [Verrucomicrobiales bacterium]
MSFSGVLHCPTCNRKVAPRANGTCPGCGGGVCEADERPAPADYSKFHAPPPVVVPAEEAAVQEPPASPRAVRSCLSWIIFAIIATGYYGIHGCETVEKKYNENTRHYEEVRTENHLPVALIVTGAVITWALTKWVFAHKKASK